MAIRYSISWFDSDTAMTAREHCTLHRSDAAEKRIYSVARNMVASWAGLDTRWGWQFMKDVLSEPIAPLPLGHMRHFRHALPQGDVIEVYVERV